MYKYILFDLDGTLTDPGIGITNSVMYALEKFGIEVEDRAVLYKFIGPPLSDSFQTFYGLSKKESELAIKYYREYFKPNGMYENEVYDGIEILLQELKKREKKLLIATSKPEEFAIEILKYFHLYDYFDFVAGASMDTSRSKKTDVITYALEKFGIVDKSSTVMVGDRKHDIFGAKENGIDSIGVLYGYGDYEEHTNAGATYIVEKVGDILKVIEGNIYERYHRKMAINVLGSTVDVIVDRPLGSYHPEYPDMYYPINYGYVEGIIAPDGEEQDVYILGVNEPLEKYTGKVIAVVRRSDDVEEKWVIAPEGVAFTKEEIEEQIQFQEQYFDSEIIV